jgi:hypothetical protein
VLYVNICLICLSAFLLSHALNNLILLYQVVAVNVQNALELRSAKKEEMRMLKHSLQREEKFKGNGLLFNYEEDSIPKVDEFPYVEEENVIDIYKQESSV